MRRAVIDLEDALEFGLKQLVLKQLNVLLRMYARAEAIPRIGD
jgi:hypothetical protein